MPKNIWYTDWLFEKSTGLNQKEEILVKDVVCTIGKKTEKNLHELKTDPFYLDRALRSYLGKLGKVYKPREAFEAYKCIRIDFKVKMGETNV